MDFSKFSYKKDDSEQEPKTSICYRENEDQTDAEDRQTDVGHSEANNVITAFNASPNYQKGDSFREPSLFFIISGGEKRERDFLKELINSKESTALKALFLSKKGQGLHPDQMQKEWQKIRKDGKFIIDDQTYYLEKIDEVFLLSDVDNFYAKLQVILSSKSNDDTGRWIISNPCFEIWLYYCYKNDPNNDLNCITSLSPNQRSKILKQRCNDVVKGGLNGIRAFGYMNNGIKNSKEHYAEDANGIPVLFATQMHEMAQCIIDKLK
ncbi:RloB domain-containing protein [Prevotella sp. oral taxon 313]|jgi:hypothetical protein|uniref:RloB family protein n=1 Tax=Prevotella sp. oral taxon 313 TaxID=652722 RepID=UPI000D1EA8D8|nr:RloB family protein [Prevotella sp. oral taxon 313]PTL30758.1 RloB domain-containing protein [Prevotella sp. oral taxon 313]